jgi:hypothetical protein
MRGSSVGLDGKCAAVGVISHAQSAKSHVTADLAEMLKAA